MSVNRDRDRERERETMKSSTWVWYSFSGWLNSSMIELKIQTVLGGLSIDIIFWW